MDEDLKTLEEGASVFVGRKSSVYEKHGTKAAMEVGMVAEERSDSASSYGKKILMDSISPHAIFICGMRGSGKSYTLGVIAEELALKNDAVGVIIIDPMGIFWSMKDPNKMEREKSVLKEWGLVPKGIKSAKVFIPQGYAKEAPKETWDEIFTTRPSELTADDWCLTFGFDRFDTMGLLIDRVLEKVKEGYTTVDGTHVEGLKDSYGISDLVDCIESEEGIHSPRQGFKTSTQRALVARLKGALEWGIFDKEGTQLRQLSRRGLISVIDVSFLQDNVRALIVGILARNVLNTRKRTSRKEAVGGSGLFESIPVTWLMIDEAHILVPGAGRKTAATDALIEYVRQGRQPGCSIVLATQQPSAIDSRILSQVDIVMCHKLVYEDDIKAVVRRMPSEVPERFLEDHFIKNLPIGMAIVGDKQEETSRCFLASIRPRISQHEGRERQPMLEINPAVMRENVKKLIQEKWGKESMEELEDLIQLVNEEYKLDFSLSEIVSELTEEGLIEEELRLRDDRDRIEPEIEVRKKRETRKKEERKSEKDSEIEDTYEEPVQIERKEKKEKIVTRPRTEISEPLQKRRKKRIILSLVDDLIEDIALKEARRMLFKKDAVSGIFKIYYPLYQVFFDFYPTRGPYQSLTCYVDGITGEIFLGNGKRTRGVHDLMELTPDQRTVLLYLMEKRKATPPDIVKGCNFDSRKVTRIIGSLTQKELVEVARYRNDGKKTLEVLKPKIKHRIMKDPRKKVISFETDEDILTDESVLPPVLKETEAKKAAEIWDRTAVWDTSLLYYPYFLISYKDRYEVIDAVTGRKDSYIKSMLAFRV